MREQEVDIGGGKWTCDVRNRQAWDLALDHCLAQLPRVIDDNTAFEHSPFFAEQLTAFQVWLSYGSEKRSPPEQLPIVLQVTACLWFILVLCRYSKISNRIE